MRLSKLSVLAFGAALLAVPSWAQATIIGGSITGGSAFTAGGVFQKLTPPLPNPFGAPNSVGNNTFQSPNLYGFDEDQNIVLSAPLSIDTAGPSLPVGTTSLPVGTTVASHYVFFDPGPNQSVIGTIDFDSVVLAIISSTGTLAASDFLANTGVNYLNPGLRGLEAVDTATISGSNQTSVDFNAGSPGDYVRVLTAFSPGAGPVPVPEPSTGTLFAIGLVGLGFLRRRRTHAV